jgi:hypothetical protein
MTWSRISFFNKLQSSCLNGCIEDVEKSLRNHFLITRDQAIEFLYDYAETWKINETQIYRHLMSKWNIHFQDLFAYDKLVENVFVYCTRNLACTFFINNAIGSLTNQGKLSLFSQICLLKKTERLYYWTLLDLSVPTFETYLENRFPETYNELIREVSTKNSEFLRTFNEIVYGV